jgi:hypothetical protein
MSILRMTAGLLIASAAILVVTPTSLEGKTPPGLKGTNYPDLVIQSISIVKMECKSARPYVTASVTVRNVSTKHAADLSQIPLQQILKVVISGGTAQSCPGVVEFTPGGPLQIPPSGSWTTTVTRCIPPGGYYIAVSADPQNRVKEISENNNYKALPLSVPDPCK